MAYSPGSDSKITEANLLLPWFVSPSYRIYRHAAMLLIVFFLVLYSRKKLPDPYDLYYKTGIVILFSSLLYLNMYVLVQKLLFRNRYGYYFLSVLGLTLFAFAVSKMIVYLFKPYVLEPRDPGGPVMQWVGFSFIFLLFIAASTGVKLFQRWVTDSQRISELEKASMQSELNILKSQINPHFLFNMLNNANVLVHRDPEKASQVLLKLSDMLRYQLYDSSRSRVLLAADIHFLTDFLNLEKIRRDHFRFTVTKQGNIDGIQTPPFLFVTFVENAIKHNMDAEKESYVHLHFQVEDGEIRFTCTNSKPAASQSGNGVGGLGLSNVKRRLELLYPDHYRLDITNEESSYQVRLVLQS